MKRIFFYLTAIALVFAGCRKDEIITDSNQSQQNPDYVYTISFFGDVNSQEGLPLSGVDVSVSGLTTTTDDNGYFRFDDVNVVRDGGLVTFEKDGYFTGYKFVIPQSGRKKLQTTLVAKGESSSFAATQGSTITTNGGATVTFKPNTISTADSIEYTGEVEIYTYWYNPTDDDLYVTMPGDLRGITVDDRDVQLVTYGMMAVELQTPDGKPLNLVEGSTATLTFPLTGIANGAPASIPLWSLDEESGIWIEEGVANKVANTYVAEVSHFSFWNCDAPFDVVNIQGLIKYSNGEPVVNKSVKIEFDGDTSGEFFNTTGYGHTDSNGEYSGKVPKDKELRLTVYDECGETSPLTIGPFSEDGIIEPIVLDVPVITAFSGMAVACDQTPLTSGYIDVSYKVGNIQKSELINVIDGKFEFSAMCTDITDIFVKAYDIEALMSSDPFEVNFVDGQLENPIVLSLCGDLDEYFILNENLLATHIDVVTKIGGLTTLLLVESETVGGRKKITISNTKLGINVPDYVGLEYFYCGIENQDECEIEIEITKLGSTTGQYIEGTFEYPHLGQIGICSFRQKFDFAGQGAKISGVVWDDDNADGIRQSNESLLSNITISMTQTVDNNVISGLYPVKTDENGYYEITSIFPGEYYITIEGINTYSPTGATSDTSVDCDFNLGILNLEEGVILENFDAGIFINENYECSYTITGCNNIEAYVEGGIGSLNYTLNANIPEAPLTSNIPIFTNLPQTTYNLVTTDALGNIICDQLIIIEEQNPSIRLFNWVDVENEGEYDEGVDGFVEGTKILISNASTTVMTETTDENPYPTINTKLNESTLITMTAPDGYVMSDGADIQIYPNNPNVGYINFTAEECGSQTINFAIKPE